MAFTEQTKLKPAGLKGISEDQINQHWALYKGYVTNTNALVEQMAKMREAGEAGTPRYAELRRRLGFEYNGMVLHEYYFGNLSGSAGSLSTSSKLYAALGNTWGSFDAWKEDFAATGKMRGIGWAILYHDPVSDTVNNHWISMHEEGHPGGFTPILVMDVWEHAYMVDWGAGGRGDYIKAFFENVNWEVVAARFESSQQGRIVRRY